MERTLKIFVCETFETEKHSVTFVVLDGFEFHVIEHEEMQALKMLLPTWMTCIPPTFSNEFEINSLNQLA